MRVTFLGTGTSQGVPIIACKCDVCISENNKDKRLRSSVLIESNTTTIVIDTGPDFRYQMLRNNVQKLDAVVFTHEHKDHIAGLDDIRAFNHKQQSPMDVYADANVQLALHREFYYIFVDKKYPGVPAIDLHTIQNNDFSIGNIKLTPIQVLHYKLPVFGYRINDFTYITDAKTINQVERNKIKGSKILVVNALQKEKHISHFTLAEAIQFAREMDAETTYFTHISHNLGKHFNVEKELPSNIKLAFDGLQLEI